ncbi:XdhC family protein [Octadecabacter sp. R77987]|uniref:XdhC family protein n=1 Tax=Octadecabacter sp. R77987 TaxID=3093874 RepID=UPI00366DB5FC
MLKNAIPLERAPLEACLFDDDPCVLAIIVGTEGPSYRPLGAMMAIFQTRPSVGSLSSGCVEADIKLHALECLNSGKPNVVRYGLGSPYLDIVLPCGGGLQILLLPNPCRETIQGVLHATIRDRRTCTLNIQMQSGDMSMTIEGAPVPSASVVSLTLEPEPRFLVFGKGPEAVAFTALAQSTGYETTLLSPDPETLEHAQNVACQTVELARPEIPASVSIDKRTAVVLFFHDHDWEPPILKRALTTPAYYIGAQGSARARDNRDMALRSAGVSHDELARIRGPIGLINSARDSRTLAISVLAEIVSLERSS